MKKIVSSLAVLLCLAPAARAEFEGVIDMKISSPQGSGTVRVAVAKAGVRTETRMGAEGMNVSMTTLVKAGEPDKAYQIDDEAKTYSVVPVKPAQKAADKLRGEKYTVQKMGTKMVRGYSCEHTIITGTRGERTELWTTKEIGDYAAFSRALGGRSGLEPGFTQDLRAAGADGFPVKSVYHGPRGEKVTMELVSVSQQAPAAALFQVPAGYARQTGPMMPAGEMPPDAVKSMKEGMKDLSPGQREMMEKMMKRK